MENKVFVWTRTDEALAAEDVEPMEMDTDDKRPSSVAGSDISEASLVGIETAPGIGAVTGGAGSSGLSLDNGRSTTRRVYRCPQCSFWATTASRFHVHMVGHTNTKPFECSQCAYRSNWRYLSISALFIYTPFNHRIKRRSDRVSRELIAWIILLLVSISHYFPTPQSATCF